MSELFVWIYCNYFVLGLDLCNSEGKVIFGCLVVEFDVVFVNFKLGIFILFGFFYDVLYVFNFWIVFVGSSVFGN